MEALRPCPLCGRLGTIRNRATPSAKPYCGFCPACGCESGQYETRELAAAAWNNRAVDPLAQALYEALKGLAWRYADEPEVCDALKNWEASR